MPEVKTNMTAKASVIIPCYNYEKYIEESIKSVLLQDFDGFELIVVNDGSQDNSLDAIYRAVEKYKKSSKAIGVKVIDQENKGVSAALNKGINSSVGEYILTHDADDIMCEGRIRLQVNYLEKNPEVGCVGGKTQRIDANNNVVSVKSRKTHR